MSEHAHTHPFNHASEKDWKTYLAILVALLILTVITVAAAGFNFGSMNVIIAMAIATVKGSLVVLFFMHLRHDKPINSIIFLSALLFLSFLLILCLIDVNSRIEPKPHNWKGPDPGLITPADLNKPPVPGVPGASAPAELGHTPASDAAVQGNPQSQPPATSSPAPSSQPAPQQPGQPAPKQH